MALTVSATQAAPPEVIRDPDIEPRIRALFDRPMASARTVLPPRGSESGPRGVARCYAYPDFTVKEIDYGDHGDTAISVTPAAPGAVRPPCGKQDDQGEVVLPGGQASYLVGVKGDFVYVESAIGMNTVPFNLYDGRSGRTLYSDQSSSDSPKKLAVEAGVLTLAYTHGAQAEGVQARCSILAGGQACWTQFARAAHLPQAIAKLPPPAAACEAGYASPTLSPRAAPSVVFYDVTMTLDNKGQAKVLTRGTLTCGPGE